MTRRQVITVGFMLFAMFFGAGNLIFPPVVGYNSGDYFWTAMLGFILTSVGLPLVASATAAISDGGYGELLSRIHPYFSVILLVSIYLTIGPLFAIPRTATTAYELGILPFMSEGSSLALLITSVIFFAATLYLVLNPDNLANSIGNYLTPILLVTILIIVVRIIWISVGNDASSAINNFGEGGPFSYGFIEGYLTMDAIAAIGFAIVVISSIKGMGVTDKNEILKGTFKSAIVATVILALVFGSLGWIGNNVYIEGGVPEGQNTGAYLLQYMSYEALGTIGTVVLAIAVLAACLTTSSGLISSCAEYFHSIVPSVSYKAFAVIFTLVSLLLANQGLDTIIQGSVPVLSLIYPVAMSAVFLLLLSYYVPSPRISLQLPIALVFVSSLLGLLYRMDFISMSWVARQPLFVAQLEWLPILVVGYIAGYLIGKGMSQDPLTYDV